MNFLRLLLVVILFTACARVERLSGTSLAEQKLSSQGFLAANAVSCYQPMDLPLFTHYKAGLGYLLGGTDDPSSRLFNPDADRAYLAGVKAVPYYVNSFFPSVNEYLANRFEPVTFSNDSVRQVFINACEQTQVPYRLRQVPIEIQSSADLKKILITKANYGQVIHAVVFRNNLFTLVLPPGFNPSSQKPKYPLLINGFYGLNQNLIKLEGPGILNVLGSLYKKDGHGAIAILWNGQGALSSRTMNDLAYQDLNDFLNIAIPELNIHTKAVVAMGGSRGAFTALNIASHPLVTAVKVRFVWAANPPVNILRISQLIGGTQPNLLAISDQDTGYAGSWDNAFVAPSNRPGVGGLSGANLHLLNLTGTFDPVFLEQHFSLLAPSKIQKLRDNKTQIVMEMGTHDNTLPFVDKWIGYQTLLNSGVAVEAQLNYLSGHTPDRARRFKRILSVMTQLNREILQGAAKTALVTPGKRIAFQFVQNGSDQVRARQLDAYAPLTFEFPRYLNEHVSAHFMATGRPGARYRVSFSNGNGFNKTVGFTLDSFGTWVQQITPSHYPVGPTTLVSIAELDSTGKIIRIVPTVPSILPSFGSLIMGYRPEDIRPYGPRIENVIFKGIYGQKGEFQPHNSTVPLEVNLGVMEAVPN
jgi:hypothetical protein